MLYVVLFWLACSGETTETGTTSTSVPDTASGDVCVETAVGTLPQNVDWIVLDGNSSELFSLSESVLSSAWEGSYGTYDLNFAVCRIVSGRSRAIAAPKYGNHYGDG